MTRPRADGQLRVRKLRLPPKAVLDRQQVVIGAVPEVRRLAYGRQVNLITESEPYGARSAQYCDTGVG